MDPDDAKGPFDPRQAEPFVDMGVLDNENPAVQVQELVALSCQKTPRVIAVSSKAIIRLT